MSKHNCGNCGGVTYSYTINNDWDHCRHCYSYKKWNAEEELNEITFEEDRKVYIIMFGEYKIEYFIRDSKEGYMLFEKTEDNQYKIIQATSTDEISEGSIVPEQFNNIFTRLRLVAALDENARLNTH